MNDPKEQVMLLVRYQLKEGEREAFLHAVEEQRIISRTLEEKGCLSYEYSLPLDADQTVCLQELWETAEAQAAHMKQPHFAVLTELKQRYVKNTDIRKYLVRAF